MLPGRFPWRRSGCRTATTLPPYKGGRLQQPRIRPPWTSNLNLHREGVRVAALVFVDTNVFVYRHDRGDPARQARADEWIAHLARSRTGRLSFQVLQEL